MTKAMRSIFYGRRILQRAEIVLDEKKKLTFKLFFIFTSDILKSFYKVCRFSVKKSSESLENNPNFPTTASK